MRRCVRGSFGLFLDPGGLPGLRGLRVPDFEQRLMVVYLVVVLALVAIAVVVR